MSHAEFLRDHSAKDPIPFVQALWRLARAHAETPPTAAVTAVLSGLGPDLLASPLDRAVVGFVARLTWTPGSVTHADHTPLREAGLDDRQILDIVQVAACFAFMNRLADGTGVMVEPSRYPLARELFGSDALHDHLAWGRPSTGKPT